MLSQCLQEHAWKRSILAERIHHDVLTAVRDGPHHLSTARPKLEVGTHPATAFMHNLAVGMQSSLASRTAFQKRIGSDVHKAASLDLGRWA